MRIAVCRAGGAGGYIGGPLVRAGAEVRVIARRPLRAGDPVAHAPYWL
jgi:hypothetical protein